MTKVSSRTSSPIVESVRPEWETPRILRMDVEGAEAAINVGADIGIYS